MLTMTVKNKSLKDLLTLLVDAVQLLMYELGSSINAKTCIGWN